MKSYDCTEYLMSISVRNCSVAIGRPILRDGEWLQANRKKLGEMVFRRRLNRLKKRLEDLLNWSDPDDVLQEIIKKVKRQQPRILTFVEHPEAPCHNNYGEFLIRIGVA